MGSSTDTKRTKWHVVERWQRLAAQNMGSCAIEQYLQWCKIKVDDVLGTEEYKCDATERLHRYANVYTALQQIINTKKPEAFEEPTAGAQKGLGPRPFRKEQVLARFARSAITWLCVSITGVNGREPDYLGVLNKAFDGKIKYAEKNDTLVAQLLKAYHECMEWFPDKFESRSNRKTHGRKRGKRVRDGACVNNLLETRDGLGLAAGEQGLLGLKDFAEKEDLKDLTVVAETVPEPLPMVLGYGENFILEPMDAEAPMKVCIKKEGEAA